MQPLSKKRHESLVTALRQVKELLEHSGVCEESNEMDIQQLDKLFVRYEQLFGELRECIGLYQVPYKHLRKDVLAPRFRLIRNHVDKRTLEYQRLNNCFLAVRGY